MGCLCTLWSCMSLSDFLRLVVSARPFVSPHLFVLLFYYTTHTTTNSTRAQNLHFSVNANTSLGTQNKPYYIPHVRITITPK